MVFSYLSSSSYLIHLFDYFFKISLFSLNTYYASFSFLNSILLSFIHIFTQKLLHKSSLKQSFKNSSSNLFKTLLLSFYVNSFIAFYCTYQFNYYYCCCSKISKIQVYCSKILASQSSSQYFIFLKIFSFYALVVFLLLKFLFFITFSTFKNIYFKNLKFYSKLVSS